MSPRQSQLPRASIELSRQIEKARYCVVSGEAPAAGFGYCIGYEECRTDYVIDRTQFPFWTLEFLMEGRGQLSSPSGVQALSAGAVFCYGPGVQHAFRNDPDAPFRKYFLARGGNEFPVAWAEAGLVPMAVTHMSQVAPLAGVFDLMLREGLQQDVHAAQIVASLEAVLLGLAQRHRGRAAETRSPSRQTYELAMDVVAREFRQLRSLADLAERTGFSAEYLCRIFRKYHGRSPYQVLLRRKINHAFLLLRDGERRVADVALEVGFEDPLHFSRQFRQHMGFPPSAVMRS